MPCLGGTGLTMDKSRAWYRLIKGEYVEQFGRVPDGCNNPHRDVVETWRERGTKRPVIALCTGCPAYRPTWKRGEPPPEIPGNQYGEPYGLSEVEYDRGIAADGTYRMDWDERHALHMYRYRQRHGEQLSEYDRARRANWTPEQRQRNRETSRERMRKMREKLRRRAQRANLS
jgi:hypothetical protein